MSESIGLYAPVKQGNGYLQNITANVRDTWQHTTRRIGGYWQAACEFRASPTEMDELFFDGILREVRFTAGGQLYWQGFIGGMTYLRGNVLWTLSLADRANAVKLIYSRLGDNLLTNGSAETGAWTAVNSATVTQSTEWVTDGSYSCKIVAADGAMPRGADVQTGIAISAGRSYEARISLRVLSGSWRVALNRSDNDDSLAYFSTAGATGDMLVTLNIPSTNTYAGNIYFEITSESTPGTVYGDGAVLRLGAIRAETEWKLDATAIATYGRMEHIVLDAALTSAAANAKASTLLKTNAWPAVTPPDEYTIGAGPSADRLQLLLQGYIFTAGWRYSPVAGTATATALMQSLIAEQSDYLVEGVIEANTMDYQVDDRLPLTCWTVASEAAKAGDASGNPWSLGCYADRKVYYAPTPTGTDYHFRGGKIYNASGTIVDPWEVQPGWLQFDDAPGTAAVITASGYDQIQRVYLEEVEYSIRNGVTFRRQASG